LYYLTRSFSQTEIVFIPLFTATGANYLRIVGVQPSISCDHCGNSGSIIGGQGMSIFSTRNDASAPDRAGSVFTPPRWQTGIRASRRQSVCPSLKRVFDIVGAVILLMLLFPLLSLLALAIRLEGGPALYRHIRVGRGDKPFGCLKYRTMVSNADQRLADHLAANPFAAMEWSVRRKLKCDPRITRLGALLRQTSLDELPQLLNVLRGQMSLIGPRPVVQEELDQHYGQAGRIAYSATRPGITGLWQISGRSGTSYSERVALDIAYVQTWSLLLDVKILVLTVPAVLARRGAV
jgi:lipopolysaccharide/colanic/teichoic acid biosynthesis glycosyltransferase